MPRSGRRRIASSCSSVRVADVEAEQEAVELRLGQRIGALVLDRVLGPDHEERVGQRVGDAVDA